MITAKEARSLMPYEINKEENIEKELNKIEKEIREAAQNNFRQLYYRSIYREDIKNKLLQLGFTVTIYPGNNEMMIRW